MSDPIEGGGADSGSGGTGSTGPNASAKITIDVSEVLRLVPLTKGVAASVEMNMKQIDRALKTVEAGMKILAVQAKTDLAQVQAAGKTAAIQAAADAKVRTALADKKKRVAIVTAEADAKIQVAAATQATIKIDQVQKRQTAKYVADQRVKVNAANQAAIQQTKTIQIVGQQQLQAAKMTAAAQSQNHQAAMLQLKQQGQMALQNARAVQQTTILNTRLTAQATNRRVAAMGGGGTTGGGGTGVLGGLGQAIQGLGGGAGGILGTLAGGLLGGGVVAGVKAGAQAIWDSVEASDALARSYSRQALAGRVLAGTQDKLNDFMVVYDKATGEALSKAKQMEGVVRLQAVGFADSRKELDQFSRAIRGISLAIGEPADFVTQNLILELFSQRGQRLDQLGLQYDDVRKRQEALMESDRSLTKQAAYQQAVLDQALARYGALADSTEGQATGVEKLSAAWDDLGLAMSQWISNVANPVADWLSKITDMAAEAVAEIAKVHPEKIETTNPEGGLFSGTKAGEKISAGEATKILNDALVYKSTLMQEKIDVQMGNSTRSAERIAEELTMIDEVIKAARISLSRVAAQAAIERGYTPQAGPDTTIGGNRSRSTRLPEDQEEELLNYSRARQKIEEQTSAALIEENLSYRSRRLDIENDFQQALLEDAEDFGRQRARDEAKFAKDIAKAQADAAERQVEIQTDLNKNLERANRDHAREIARYERDHNKRLADLKKDSEKDEAEVGKDFDKKQEEAKKDSGKKIAEMEEEFARDREKAQRASNESILQSAAHLDAEAVFFEQKKFAREKKEAEEEQARKLAKEKEGLTEELDENTKAKDERLAEIRDQLKEQLQEENEAHKQRLADSNEAHAQQLADQQDAAKERLEEAVKDDADRLKEMQDGHAERLAEEDSDRAIRLGREQAHHNTQLTELDRVHGERILQIGRQATAEKTALDAAHRQALLDLGFHNAKWEEAQRRANARALKEHEIFLKQSERDTLTSKRDELQRRLTNPSTTPAEQQVIIDTLKFLGDQIIGINTSIQQAQTDLENLPLPDYQEDSSAIPGGTQQRASAVRSMASGVQLGIWQASGRSAGAVGPSPLMTGGSVINLKVEAGAIVITPLPGQSISEIGDIFESRMLNVLQKVAKVKVG